MLKALFAAGTLSALLAQTPQPAAPPSPSPAPVTPAPSPSATPAVTPSASPSPLPSATPSPSPSPSSSPSPSPSPLPSSLPTPLVLPPDAPPQILAIQLSDPVFHGGETVTATVITSTNVAAVEIRLSGHTMRLPRADFGVFEMTYQVPHVPFWFRKTYTAQVVAMNSAGVEAAREVSVSLR